MAKHRRQYSREFKVEAVQLWETSDRTAPEIEQELGIGKGVLVRWKRELAKDGADAFPGHGRLTPDEERVRQLERENEILRQERDILKKAIAIFSHPKQ
jgi:transposase